MEGRGRRRWGVEKVCVCIRSVHFSNGSLTPIYRKSQSTSFTQASQSLSSLAARRSQGPRLCARASVSVSVRDARARSVREQRVVFVRACV